MPKDVCLRCGTSTIQGAQFCQLCGAELGTVACPQCAKKCPLDSRFCPSCGYPLAAGSDSARTQSLVPLELRPVTIMFLDVVESTQISEQLGPESFHTFVRELQSIIRKIIEVHEGYVAQYSGDGVLAYFGYPSAHDDHARFAVEAGLEILKKLTGWPGSEWPQRPGPIQVRIACHVGPLIMEAPDRLSRIPPAEGAAINVAARLQTEAPPASLVISQDCLDLVEGFYETQFLGTKRLRGLKREISAFHVLGRRASGTRFEATHSSGLKPMVGRGHELLSLQQEWQRSAGRRGRAVVVVGEPGIGKSRLVDAFRLGVEAEHDTYNIVQCEELLRNTAFGPFINLIARQLSLDAAGARGPGAHEQVLSYLRRIDLDASFCKDIELLLGLPIEEQPVITPVESYERTRKFLRQFVAVRRDNVSILIVEDLHWSDPSTLDLVSELIAEGPVSGLYILVTTRPEALDSKLPLKNAIVLNLPALEPEEARQVLANLDDGCLGSDHINQIVERSDGIPLFIEECYRAQTQQGRIAGNPIGDIPERLQGVIWQRLDHLHRYKWVAQLASVCGVSFWLDHLTDVARSLGQFDKLSNAVPEAIEALQNADLVVQGPGRDAGQFKFRHSLIHKAAYESLPVTLRRAWHGKVADVIEQRSTDGLHGTMLEVVARHRAAAGQPEAAIDCFAAAGQEAISRFGNNESIALLTAAIEECAKIPDRTKARGLEIKLRLMLNTPIVAESGWAAANLETNGNSLLSACLEVSAGSQAFEAHRMLFNVALLRADSTEAERHIRGMEGLHQDASGYAPVVDRCRGAKSMFLDGDIATADFLLARSLPGFDLIRHSKEPYDLDSEVAVQSIRSWLRYFSGDAGSAIKQAYSAIRLAQSIDHPFSLAYALCLGGSALLSAGEAEAASAAALEARALALKYRMSYWIAYAEVLIGGASAKKDAELGIRMLGPARDAYLKTGARLILPWILALEAEGWHQLGDRGKAIALLHQSESYEVHLFDALVRRELAAMSGA